MIIKESLINSISSDLRIYKFKDEENEEFLNRLLYSACATWLLQSARDICVTDGCKKDCVSKSYLTRKVSKIVNLYIELFPTFSKFLGGSNANELVSNMRLCYEKAGFIVPVGFSEFVKVSQIRQMHVEKEWYLVRNKGRRENIRVVGLGEFCKGSQVGIEFDLESMFYLPRIDALKWTNEYINNIKWSNSQKIGKNAKYFDSNMIANSSESWKEQFPDNQKVTLYKTNDWDYGFAMKTSERIIGVKIPDHLIGVGSNRSELLYNNDVRRFIHGLKAIHNNNIRCCIVKKNEYLKLRLFSAIPEREFTALQFFGWKANQISDDYNYIFPIETLDCIKQILEKLSIVIEEKLT